MASRVWTRVVLLALGSGDHQGEVPAYAAVPCGDSERARPRRKQEAAEAKREGTLEERGSAGEVVKRRTLCLDRLGDFD